MSELHLINQLQMAAIRRNHKAYIYFTKSLWGSICRYVHCILWWMLVSFLEILWTYQTPGKLYIWTEYYIIHPHLSLLLAIQCPLCHIAPSRLRHSPHQFSHRVCSLHSPYGPRLWPRSVTRSSQVWPHPTCHQYTVRPGELWQHATREPASEACLGMNIHQKQDCILQKMH